MHWYDKRTKGWKDDQEKEIKETKRYNIPTLLSQYPPLLQAFFHLIYVVIILKINIKIEQESKLCFGVGNCYEIQQIGSTLTGMSSKRWEQSPGWAILRNLLNKPLQRSQVLQVLQVLHVLKVLQALKVLQVIQVRKLLCFIWSN